MGSSFSTIQTSFSDLYYSFFSELNEEDIQPQTPWTLVLQTGDLRSKHISKTIGLEFDSPGFEHRFLPSGLESKYEALDFVNKFGLNKTQYFSLFDGEHETVEIQPFRAGENQSPLCGANFTIVASCGSSSFQAFKIDGDGVIPLLPITDVNRDLKNISGNKEDPNLSVESLSQFGGKSGESKRDVARSIVEFLQANAESRHTILGMGDILFVNQIGYSVLGFNPRNGPSPVPTKEQKIVSIQKPSCEFNTNDGKTQVIQILHKIMNEVEDNGELKYPHDNMYLAERQVKVDMGPDQALEELSGQWANEAGTLMYEDLLELENQEVFDTVIDLGGGSGSYYKKTQEEKFVKDHTKRGFMKEKGKQPNDFINDLDAFIDAFDTAIEN
jgi:hypothetical protein